MKRNTFSLGQTLPAMGFLLLMSFMGGCDIANPSDVSNPRITDENLAANASGGAKSLITGLRRQFSIALGNTAYITDVASDNYYNIVSFISNQLDAPRTITLDDITMPNVYHNLEALNALADFGLKTIIPADNTATNDQKAETRFYKGMALMMLAENFTAFIGVENGPVVAASAGVTQAIDQFTQALALTSNASMKNNCQLALARVHRLNRDKVNALAAAQAALALSANYVFSAAYDAANLVNPAHPFVVSRASNDMQPLPRLDFLDPKYVTTSVSIPSLKAEEAHLIIAEAAIANGDLAGARTAMTNAANLARTRPTTLAYNDKDARPGRPNTSTWKVKSDASASSDSGLIFRRGGTSTVTVYPVSYTNVTAAAITALSTQTQENHLRMLYLLRQHIFLLEGRRMSDLGIRFPVTRRQTDTNRNIPIGSVGTTVVVPPFIPGADDVDKFTTDATAGLVTIAFDMNRLIAQNISLVSPFF